MRLSTIFSSWRGDAASPSSPSRVTQRHTTYTGVSWILTLSMALSFAAFNAVEAKGIGGTRQLYTSSVAYCSPPVAVLVTDLQLRFFPDNSTLEFSIDAASQQNNLSVSVNLVVNAYGLGLFSTSINLCDIAGGIICPLPDFRFQGGGIFPVPESLVGELPGIAYAVPNLEAVATVQLVEVGTSQVVGCVQATLSNGHTAQQAGALWASVGVALLALFSSLLHSVIARSVGAAQWRVIDVMLAIQHPAIASLLSLNYPVVFVSYGLNFAWSIGLVNIPGLQRSISATRAATGDDSKGTFGNTLTATVGRKYSPFGSAAATSSGSGSGLGSLGLGSLAKRGTTALRPISSFANIFEPSSSLARRAQYAPNTGPDGSLLTNTNSIALPLLQGNNTNKGDIATFGERLDLPPSNLLLTVIVSITILLAIVTGALLATYLIALIVRRSSRRGSKSAVAHWSERVTKPAEFWVIASAMFGRVFLVTFPVLVLFSFYQFAYRGSWVSHMVAGIFLGLYVAIGAIYLIPMIKYARRGSPDDLYYHGPPVLGSTVAKRFGSMTHGFRPSFYYFAYVFLLWSIIRACFIVFAQGRGFLQAVGLLCFELVLFVAQLAFRVGRDKKSDWVFAILTFSRVAAWGVCVAFTERANVTTIPRVIVGFVLLVVTALPIIFLAFLTIWDLFTPFLKRNRRSVKPDSGTEKGDLASSTQSQSAEATADSRFTASSHQTGQAY